MTSVVLIMICFVALLSMSAMYILLSYHANTLLMFSFLSPWQAGAGAASSSGTKGKGASQGGQKAKHY